MKPAVVEALAASLHATECSLLLACNPASPRIEPRLQDEHRSHPVDDPLAAPRLSIVCRVSRVVEVPMRLRRRQPLVPKMHDDRELRPQFFGEGLRLGRLRTLVARHIQRVADDRLGNMMLAKDAGDGLHLRAPVRAMEREERLRGEAEWIGERNADAPVADIEAGDARRKHCGNDCSGLDRIIHRASVLKHRHDCGYPTSRL